MQSGPLTFCANAVTFPCLVLVWVWHILSVPSSSATGRTIILVPSLSQRSSFLKILVDQLEFASAGESAGALGNITDHPRLSSSLPPLPQAKVFMRPWSCLHPAPPTAAELTCDSRQWLQLLCPRQGRQASPLSILGSQEREKKQEVTCGLESESGVLHRPQ